MQVKTNVKAGATINLWVNIIQNATVTQTTTVTVSAGPDVTVSAAPDM